MSEVAYIAGYQNVSIDKMDGLDLITFAEGRDIPVAVVDADGKTLFRIEPGPAEKPIQEMSEGWHAETRRVAEMAGGRRASWSYDSIYGVCLAGGIYPVMVAEPRTARPEVGEHIARMDPASSLGLLDEVVRLRLDVELLCAKGRHLEDLLESKIRSNELLWAEVQRLRGAEGGTSE